MDDEKIYSEDKKCNFPCFLLHKGHLFDWLSKKKDIFW